MNVSADGARFDQLNVTVAHDGHAGPRVEGTMNLRTDLDRLECMGDVQLVTTEPCGAHVGGNGGANDSYFGQGWLRTIMHDVASGQARAILGFGNSALTV